MTPSLPMARISTFRLPSGRQTSEGRLTAWVQLVKKTVGLDMGIYRSEGSISPRSIFKTAVNPDA